MERLPEVRPRRARCRSPSWYGERAGFGRGLDASDGRWASAEFCGCVPAAGIQGRAVRRVGGGGVERGRLPAGNPGVPQSVEGEEPGEARPSGPFCGRCVKGSVWAPVTGRPGME